MNPMHPRSDHDVIQNAFEPKRQPPIGMMKKRGGFESNKENEQHHGRDTEEKNSQGEERDGKHHFAKMESRGGGDIEIKVGVMDVMKAPEQRHHVIDVVPPPIGVIHQ